MEREMYDLTNEQLCDIMCSSIEYDDNDYYIHNCDNNIDLWHYLHIDKSCVNVKLFSGEIYRYDELEEYDWFDWCDVDEQFAIIKIESLTELMDLIYNWGKPIIISEPTKWDIIQIPHIKIYDGWNK